jgi:phage-related protein
MMNTFPLLKTAAVAQYPASRCTAFRNQTLRFIDGTEQRYRGSAGPLHRWKITLKQLDESEVRAVEEFVASNSGMFGTFAFRDPWDGTLYPTCSLESDDLDVTTAAEMNGSLELTIVENRK